MGSHPTQAVGIAVFFVSFVVLAGAFAGGGLLCFLLFVALLGASIAIMLKCKAIESAAE